MVSIIIVHYKVKEKLFACLNSIYLSKPKTDFEIIVVDNDETKTIGKELLKEFPKVKYIQSPVNLGYGGGNNLGAKSAIGSHLFFLNPDTILFKDTIDNLFQFLNKDKHTGIVSPLLINKQSEPFVLQGTKELTLLRGIVCLSFLNKILPDNPVSNSYWLKDWDHKNNRQVDVCPGTAFMIAVWLFQKIGGFDEKFFLFYPFFCSLSGYYLAQFLVPPETVLVFKAFSVTSLGFLLPQKRSMVRIRSKHRYSITKYSSRPHWSYQGTFIIFLPKSFSTKDR